MKDSKFNMNRKELSDTEVNEAKDFDSVLKGAKPTANPNWKKYIGIGSAILLIGAVATYLLMPNDSVTVSEEPDGNKDSEIVYTNPIDGVDVPLESFIIKADEGKTITLTTGTVITIPVNAFTDASGSLIAGKVDLKFREFHDVPSIFASGIPMNYDSAGTNYQFESAGMFEIKAYQNEQEVFINPNALINVDLASKQTGDYFNIYLQNEDGTWDFKRKDTVGTHVTDSFIPDAIQKSEVKNAKKTYAKADKTYRNSLKKGKILLPQVADNSLYAMQLQYKPSEFPELASYKDILFEITEENKDFDPLLASQEWDDIRLEKSITKGYKMLLFGGGKKEKLFVRPVFSSKNLSKANATFDELFATYDAQLGGKLTQEKVIKDSLFQVYKTVENQYDFQQASASFEMGEASAQDVVKSSVKRLFEIEEFGMWNSDCPAKLPKGKEIDPIFVDEKNPEDTLKFSMLYLAEYDKNALFTIYGNWEVIPPTKESDEIINATTIGFNPKHATVIWGVTTDAKLAVFKPEKFNDLTTGDSYTVLKMEIIEGGIADVSQIKKALDWQ